MSKPIVWIILAILVIGGIGYAVTRDDDPETPANTTTEQHQDSTATTEADEQAPAETAEATSTVTIESFAYSPKKITVKKGTTVTWTNKDSVAHTVTPDTPSADFTASNLLEKDQTYSFTFNKAGTYTYHCQPHPNMTATVEVTE